MAGRQPQPNLPRQKRAKKQKGNQNIIDQLFLLVDFGDFQHQSSGKVGGGGYQMFVHNKIRDLGLKILIKRFFSFFMRINIGAAELLILYSYIFQ